MTFCIGDKVKLLREKGEGTVTQIINPIKLLVNIDGFELPYYIDDLVKIEEDHDIDFNFRGSHTVSKKESVSHKKGISSRAKQNEIREIDLHFHELIENPNGLSNWDIMQIQLNKVVSSLNLAIRNRESKLIFIHGVGEGVLKNEVRTLLKSFENIEYQDASYRKYGYGATEVSIRNSR